MRLLILVSGQVQGVFFRYSSKNLALHLGITGYAKNLPNGKVELLAEGEKPKIDAFVDWCYKGPDGAYLEDVDLKKLEGKHSYSEFRIY